MALLPIDKYKFTTLLKKLPIEEIEYQICSRKYLTKDYLIEEKIIFLGELLNKKLSLAKPSKPIITKYLQYILYLTRTTLYIDNKEELSLIFNNINKEKLKSLNDVNITYLMNEIGKNLQKLGIVRDNKNDYEEYITRLTKQITLLENNLEKLTTDVSDKKEKIAELELKIDYLLRQNSLTKENNNALKKNLSISKRKNMELQNELLKLKKTKGLITNLNKNSVDSYLNLGNLETFLMGNSNFFNNDFIKNKVFHLNNLPSDKPITFIFISDLHCNNNNFDVITRLIDKIYNYASKKGIKNIFDLGDFFDIKFGDSNALKTWFNFLNQVEKCFPKEKTINYHILGGNHDESFVKYNMDLLNELSKRRFDIIPLGYEKATIYLNNDNDYFILEHPKVKIDTKLANIMNYTLNVDSNALMNYYSRINFLNGYCMVPNLLSLKAWQVMFYQDGNNNINYCLYMPLVINNEVINGSEIIDDIKKRKLKP